MDSEDSAKQAAGFEVESLLPKLELTEKHTSATKLAPSEIETLIKHDNYLVVKTTEGVRVFTPDCREVDDFSAVGYPGIKLSGKEIYEIFADDPVIFTKGEKESRGALRWISPSYENRDFPPLVRDYADQAMASLLTNPQVRKKATNGQAKVRRPIVCCSTS